MLMADSRYTDFILIKMTDSLRCASTVHSTYGCLLKEKGKIWMKVTQSNNKPLFVLAIV